MVIRLLVALCLFQLSASQFIRQCTCNEFKACEGLYQNSLIGCADRCQAHVTGMGANYQMLRTCMVQRGAAFKAMLGCAERTMYNACAHGAPGMVPKRRTETFKIAAINEINNILGRAGTSAAQAIAVGRGFGTCVMKCMDKSTGACFKRLDCGLALPADNLIVQAAKQCAMANGLNTQGVQSLCQCMAGAGLRQLSSICPRIIIQ